ncbi:MAG: four helix bundle protein [Chitinophagales bacterium]
MRNFREYEIWKNAIELADIIYSITDKFPSDQKFGLTNQLQRSVVSFSANIAEGASRISEKDFARFLEIALGSAYETESHLVIAQRRKFISDEAFNAISQVLIPLEKQITHLIMKLRH